MNWDELAVFSAQILGLIALIGAAYKGFKAFEVRLDTNLDKKLEPILHEVQPNSGGSMKDVLGQLESNQYQIQNSLGVLGSDFAVIKTKLTALIANSDVAWYEMDYMIVDGKPTVKMSFVNEAYLHLYQVSEEEALTSLVWRERIHIKDLNRLDAAGAYSLQNKTDYYVEYEMAHDGLLVPVVVRAKTIWVNGALVGWAGAVTPKWHKAVPLPDGYLNQQLPKPSWL